VGPTLGQRLRALRIERGLSQADLAGDLVSPSYVSLIESDRRSPEREVLEGLARRLGCSALFLESGVAPEEINEQRLRLKFAEIALANGDLGEARQRFLELLPKASSEFRHEAIWGLARTDEASGSLHEALTHMDALIEANRAGEAGAPGLLTLLIAQCRIYRQAGDYTRSVEVGESALREVRALGLEGTEDEITLASTLAGSYRSRGDMFSAQHLASQVIDRAEKLGSRQAQGNAYWSACTVAASRGQLTMAIEFAAKTLALLSESSPGRNLAAIRITYAWLLLRSDPPRLAEADSMLMRAHEVLTELSYAPLLAACETEMAWSALLRGSFGEAAEVAGRAMARCAETDVAELHNARVIYGLAIVMSGAVDEGAEAVSAAASRLAELGSQLEAAQAWHDLADALIARGRSEQAIGALRRAAECAGVRPSGIPTDLPVPARD
jgi:transcriptional regulator with XRE-family HTH domain